MFQKVEELTKFFIQTVPVSFTPGERLMAHTGETRAINEVWKETSNMQRESCLTSVLSLLIFAGKTDKDSLRGQTFNQYFLINRRLNSSM